MKDMFLYSYEAEFIQSLLSASSKRVASQFSLKLKIEDTKESNTCASDLDLFRSIGRGGQLRIFLYDKLDDFNFHVTNFPFLFSNISSSPAYGVFISQL